MSTLADGLSNSSLDPVKVDAAVAQVARASAAVRAATADALNQLHATLTPAQRAALVDKLESHWEVWQRSNAEEQKEVTADEGHLAVLTVDLKLTPGFKSKDPRPPGQQYEFCPARRFTASSSAPESIRRRISRWSVRRQNLQRAGERRRRRRRPFGWLGRSLLGALRRSRPAQCWTRSSAGLSHSGFAIMLPTTRVRR